MLIAFLEVAGLVAAAIALLAVINWWSLKP